MKEPISKGKSTTPKKVRVSQSTIDDIKRMGMKKALELAGQNASATQAGVTAEWAEGVRRMYGQKRYDAAAKAASTPAKPKSYGKNNAPSYRPATAGQVKFNASKAASASAQGKGPKSSMVAGRTSSTSAPKDTRSNATKLFDLFGGKNGTNPKSKEKAAYLEAEKKRVAAARKKEEAARAARNKQLKENMSAKHNLVCEQGATFTFQFVVKTGDTPWNLSGYTATMTIKPFIESTTATVTATTANGKIVLGTTNGQATTTLSAATTGALEPGRYVYDFVLNSGSVVTRLLEGKFVVTAGVTV